MGVLQKNFFGQNKKPLWNLRWFHKGYKMVLFGFLYFTLWQSVSNERDRQDKRRYCYPQMPKSCSRGCPRSCPIKTKKGELSPVKTIWLGQVEPEQDKKKNPGNRWVSRVFGHFEVSISACWTAERDERLWDRTSESFRLQNPLFIKVFKGYAIGLSLRLSPWSSSSRMVLVSLRLL